MLGPAGKFLGQGTGDRLGERAEIGPFGRRNLGKERKEGQLRKDDEVGPLAGRLLEGGDPPPEVVLQIVSGVLLNESDDHETSLPFRTG